MPTWTKKENSWREALQKALDAAGVWEEFDQQRKARQKEIVKAGQKDYKIAARKAWHEVAERFPGILDMKKFEADRKKEVEKEQQERRRQMIEEGTIKMPAPAEEPNTAVIIENSIEGDILRDTKWVYFNLARLIKTSRSGNRTLDRKVLAEAPSNGAVGMAQYALDEPKAFMERFVVKILPKDEAPEKVPTEEEKRAELDPTLSELERYMKKHLK